MKKIIPLVFAVLSLWACVPSLVVRQENKSVPKYYAEPTDTNNTAQINWRDFFSDPHLTALIDTALRNNQELNIFLQEVEISKNEIMTRKGEYLPFVNLGVASEVEKPGEFTRNGAVEHNLEIKPGQAFPDPFTDFQFGANVSWEIDVWKKLRNAKKAATLEYLSSIEGKNFLVTNMVSEIANSYYELMALDNLLSIVKQNIKIQQNALKIVKLQKQAAKVSELAVKKFEAEVLKNQSYQFILEQRIVETENKINFLAGRFPQAIQRDSDGFSNLIPDTIYSGIPSQLLGNRPDIRQAELELEAAKLDIKAAKANFYPSLGISAGIGYQAFNPKYLITTPASLMYSMAGDIVAPLINRNAIKATYLNSNAKQIQAVYNYERSILNGFTEVFNQLSNINNLKKSYDLKEQQVAALNQSITISTNLFQSAKADYMEVLMTQRDALDSRMELIEIKKLQLNAYVNVYRALGGGWE